MPVEVESVPLVMFAGKISESSEFLLVISFDAVPSCLLSLVLTLATPGKHSFFFNTLFSYVRVASALIATVGRCSRVFDWWLKIIGKISINWSVMKNEEIPTELAIDFAFRYWQQRDGIIFYTSLRWSFSARSIWWIWSWLLFRCPIKSNRRKFERRTKNANDEKSKTNVNNRMKKAEKHWNSMDCYRSNRNRHFPMHSSSKIPMDRSPIPVSRLNTIKLEK